MQQRVHPRFDSNRLVTIRPAAATSFPPPSFPPLDSIPGYFANPMKMTVTVRATIAPHGRPSVSRRQTERTKRRESNEDENERERGRESRVYDIRLKTVQMIHSVHRVYAHVHAYTTTRSTGFGTRSLSVYHRDTRVSNKFSIGKINRRE